MVSRSLSATTLVGLIIVLPSGMLVAEESTAASQCVECHTMDSARLELAFHGCRPWVIPLYEPPSWGEMRESNSRDWSHNRGT